MNSRDSTGALPAAAFAAWLAAFVAPLSARPDVLSLSALRFWALALTALVLTTGAVFLATSRLRTFLRLLVLPVALMLSPWLMAHHSSWISISASAALVIYLMVTLRDDTSDLHGTHAPLETPAAPVPLPRRFTALFSLASLALIAAALTLDVSAWPNRLHGVARVFLIGTAFAASIVTLGVASIALNRPRKKPQQVPARVAVRLIIATLAFGLFLGFQAFE